MRKAKKKKWNEIGLKYALNGLWQAFKSGKNLKIAAIAAAAVIILAICFSTSAIENAILAITIGLAISAELFNSAIEKTVDVSCDDILSKELKKDPINHNAKLAKDISAGAALVTALTALVVGIIIFLPKIIAWLS